MKNQKSKELEVLENSQEAIALSKKDISYLERYFDFNNHGPKILYDKNANTIIKNGSFAGIIQLENSRILFRQKINSDLFSILSFLEDEDSFIYDCEKLIPLKSGSNFYEIVGKIFISKINKISKRGFIKRYVKKTENCRHIRGKIIIGENLKSGHLDKSSIVCQYEDLTYNNLENKIILYGAKVLLKKIKRDTKLKLGVINKIQELENFVTLTDFDLTSINNIQFDRFNWYYKDIVSLSKFLIRNEFIGAREYDKKILGFNFLVDMNRVFESFLTKIIQEVVSEKYPEWNVFPQKKLRTLDKEGKLEVRPDILLKNKKNNSIIIIDAKYKLADKNADYYQVLCYLLASKNSKSGCLIYPSSENVKLGELFFSRNIDETPEAKYNLPVFSKEINLGKDGQEISYSTFKENTKSDVAKILERLFDFA